MVTNEIGNILDEELEYDSVTCRVVQYDIDDNLIWIESIDGTWISDSGGDKQVLTFEEFIHKGKNNVSG